MIAVCIKPPGGGDQVHSGGKKAGYEDRLMLRKRVPSVTRGYTVMGRNINRDIERGASLVI